VPKGGFVLDITVSAIRGRPAPARLAAEPAGARPAAVGGAVALPIRTGDDAGVLVPTDWPLADPVAAEVDEFLRDVTHRGSAGSVHVLARPTREPSHCVLVGVGDGDAAGWRAAGAAVATAVSERLPAVTVAMPADPSGAAAREFALGAWLASYEFRLKAEPATTRTLRRITLAHATPDSTEAIRAAVGRARAIAEAVVLARDLTNSPSLQKSPRWFADRRGAPGARALTWSSSVRASASTQVAFRSNRWMP
jgi:leucyl aminopeptidase